MLMRPSCSRSTEEAVRESRGTWSGLLSSWSLLWHQMSTSLDQVGNMVRQCSNSVTICAYNDWDTEVITGWVREICSPPAAHLLDRTQGGIHGWDWGSTPSHFPSWAWKATSMILARDQCARMGDCEWSCQSDVTTLAASSFLSSSFQYLGVHIRHQC